MWKRRAETRRENDVIVYEKGTTSKWDTNNIFLIDVSISENLHTGHNFCIKHASAGHFQSRGNLQEKLKN